MGRKNNNTNQKKANLINREYLLGIETTDRLLAIIFILAVVLLPLIIRVHTGQFIAPRFIGNPLNTGIRGDVFTYYKAIMLYILAFGTAILMLQKIILYRWEIRASYINIPVLVLATTILLSGIMAEYKGIALFGIYNRNEGTLTYLAYLLLFFAAANTSCKPWLERFIKWGLAVVMLINVTIIMFHFYGHDLYQLAFTKALLIPAELRGTKVSGTLWSTINNPNYISGFASALTAFFLALALRAASWKMRLIWSVASILAFAMMLAAISTSGWVALALTLPLLMLLAIKSPDPRASFFTGGIAIIGWVLVFLLLNSYNLAVSREPASFLQKTIGQTAGDLKAGPEPVPTALEPVVSGKAATAPPATDEFRLPTPGHSAGSGRMYIWKKTIELIEQNPLLGYGHDTLPYHFPQNDPGKIAGLGRGNTIVDKPHSAYLEMAYGSGFIALLAFLALLGWHFYFGCRYLLNPRSKQDSGFQGALLAFFLAFTIQWLFNDSIIGTSVIFWTLFGISANFNTP